MSNAFSDKRTGPRIPIKVPVTVSGQDSSDHLINEQTETLLVNDGGALLALAADIPANSRARITNQQTGASTEFRVAWRSAARLNQRWSYGIALLGDPDNFWNLQN